MSVIDPATDTITSSIAVGSDPDGVVADPAGGAAYVVNTGSNSVSALDTAADTVTATIAVGTLPFDIAMAPAPPAASLNPGTTTCDGTYGGSGQNVTVPAGDVCTLLAGTQVSKNVQVSRRTG